MATKIMGRQSLGPSPRVQSQRTIATYQPIVADQTGGLGGMARAFEYAADTVEGIIEDRQRQELAAAHSSFTAGKIALEEELAADTDWRTAEKRYKSKLASLKDSAAKSISSPRAQSLFAQVIQDDLARAQARVKGRVRALEADHSVAELNTLLQTNRDLALRASDPKDRSRLIEASQMAILAAQERGFLSATDAGEAGRKWTTDYAEAFLDMRTPAERIGLLSEGKGPVAFLPVDRQQEIREAAEAELLKQQQVYAARSESDLEIAVSRGQAGVREIEAAYNAGWLSPSKRVSLTKAADAKAQERQAVQAEIGRVALAVSAGLPLDPSSAADRNAVDQHFSGVFLPSVADKEPVEIIEATLGYVRGTGILPTPIKSQWTAVLRGTDPNAKAEVSDAVARLEEVNPRLAENFDQQDRRLALSIASNLRLGLDANTAVGRAQKAIYEAGDPERKERERRLSEEKLLDNAESAVADALAEPAFFSFDFGDAAVPDRLIGEYRQHYREHFLATGDADAAEELALGDIRQQWAVTRVGDERRLMKYAPERYGPAALSDADNADWMNEQLEADVSALGLPTDGLRLEADRLTARASNPSWLVMRLNENGVYDVLLDREGRPLRWRPDFSKSSVAREQAEETAETVAAAKKKRKSRLADPRTPVQKRRDARQQK